MRRGWAVGLALSFMTGVVLGCAERQFVAEDKETEEMPACLTIHGYGKWDDGQMRVLQDENGDTVYICMCMTWEEQSELAVYGDVEDFIEHEINVRALEECERISGFWGFDEDPCQEYYETGVWLDSTGFAFDDTAYKNREGLTCDDEGEAEELGCALCREPGWLAWLLVLGGLLGLRRRRTGCQVGAERPGRGW